MEISAETSETDLSLICFSDPEFIRLFALSDSNILEYFSYSPFYNKTSSNERLRASGRPLADMRQMIGIEYESMYAKASDLFVIRELNRFSPINAEIVSVYYVLDGTIYPSPIFSRLIKSRTQKLSFYIRQAIESVREDLTYSATGEASWQSGNITDSKATQAARLIGTSRSDVTSRFAQAGESGDMNEILEIVKHE